MSRIIICVLAAIASVIVWTLPAVALDPAPKCEAGKLKEAGKYGYCRLKADSVAVKKGIPADYSKCVEKFSDKWGKLETKAGAGICPSENDLGDINDLITAQANLVAGLLSGGGGGNEDPNGVYVATPADGGDNVSGCGMQAQPCATIFAGVLAAAAQAKQRVYVAGGDYFEDVILADGFDVLGGFDPVGWESSPGTHPTTIYGSTGGGHRAAVSATGIVFPTTFSGFVVYGAPATTPSANSYGIYVTNSSDQLLITDNVIFAGSGAAGANGADGSPGQQGVPGQGANPPGGDAAYDPFIATGSGSCDASNDRQYSNGGNLTCGSISVSGGDGGGNRCTPSPFTEFSGIDGASGHGSAAGAGGDAGDDGELWSSGTICYLPTSPMLGQTGLSGGDGTNGSGGFGCSNSTGFVTGGHWVGASAASGVAGSPGSGGGGGGGGGGALCGSCTENKDRLGGHGGGGGSGGCGGGGGGVGTSGGASFGLFVVGGTPPTVVDNVFYLGTGGPGGNGGNGGVGGPGALGGAGGGVPGATYCHEAGGSGGTGGSGGMGGGGGGACGGSTFGIYTSGVGSPSYCDAGSNNLFAGGNAGSGGNGGLSLGNYGTAGLSGAVIDCSFN